MSVHRYTEADPVRTAQACARHMLTCLEDALRGEDYATLAVSGGTSPIPLFEALAAAPFDWRRVRLYLVDERCVSPWDSQSNYRMIDRHLVVPTGIPRRNVHRIYTELEPQRAAERYAEDIRDTLGLAQGEIPQFDVIHLGVGPDGHTASLFPGDPLIEDREHIAGAVREPKAGLWRVTLLPAVLLRARHTVVFAPGPEKAAITRAIFESEFNPMRLPAQIPAHLGRGVAWFLDKAAAGSE